MNDVIAELYRSGMSTGPISANTGLSVSTVRRRLIAMGLLRSRKEAMAIAVDAGRMGRKVGAKIPASEKMRQAAKRAARVRWERTPPKGKSLKSSGYIEYTTGPHKHRGEHVVIAEQAIGRHIKPNECVHHIDGNKRNNDPSNLVVMTFEDHSRLHAMQKIHHRSRNEKGQFV